MKYIKEYKLFEAKKGIDQIKDINIPMPQFDRTPNTEINGEPTREITKKELDEFINYFSKTPVYIYKGKKSETPDFIEYHDYDSALKISISYMIGTWITNPNDFINGDITIEINGINYKMK